MSIPVLNLNNPEMFASEVSRVSTTLTGRKEQGRSLTEVKDREMGWIFRSWGIKLFIEKRERMYPKVSIKSHETLNRAINRKGRGLGSLAGLGNGKKLGVRVVKRDRNWPDATGKEYGVGTPGSASPRPRYPALEKPAPGRKEPEAAPPSQGTLGAAAARYSREADGARRLLTFGHLPVADVLQVVALAGSEIYLGGLRGSRRRRYCHSVPGRCLIDLRLVVRLRRPGASAQLGAGIGGHATGQRVPHGAFSLLATVAASARPPTLPRSAVPPPPTMARPTRAARGYAGATPRKQARPRPLVVCPPGRRALGRAPGPAAPPPPSRYRLPRAD